MILKLRYAWLTGKQIVMIQEEITKVQNIVSKIRVVQGSGSDEPDFLK